MTEVFDMSVPGEREAGLARAVETLARGEVVAIPTETVYGLAADATLPLGVARIFEVKGRPRFNPLIVHVPSIEAAEQWAEFDPLARKLTEALWPGPLTLVLPKRVGSGIAELATAGLDTIAIRVPAHPVAQALLEAYGRPLAAPSANRSGKVSPTTAAHVTADLGDAVEVILDGGPASVGLESTIVSTAGGRLTLLRPGGLAAEEIERVAGRALERGEGGPVRAPGMLASHYAPAAALRLGAHDVRPGEVLLAFGSGALRGAEGAVAVRNLSPSGDLREAAANLFGALRELDGKAATIAVMPVPETGLGVAINDRLRRAAAPRND
ncbi:MAG: threonylcarbamoyl-AMP synthase [Bauldia sp.]|nr:threonylcarbamoyl-AMP synthase [Bauldia sp.]